MAYFTTSQETLDSDSYCDQCAQGDGFPDNPNGVVPFVRDPGAFAEFKQQRPWKWAPWHLGCNCGKCGKPI